MPYHVTLVTAAFLVFASWAPGAGAPGDTRPRARSSQSEFWFTPDIAPYRALVELYRDGRPEEAIYGLLRLGRTEVRRTVDAVRDRDAGRAGPDANPSLNERLFRLAAMLHTDAAEASWSTGRQQDALFHVDIARRWADVEGVTPSSAGSFRRRWYLAAGLLVFEQGGWGPALAYFDRACEALPDDAPLLTTAAWLHERFALSPVAVPGDARETGLLDAQRAKRRSLSEAARRLTAALAAEPSASEAALRLARVRTLLGETADARSLLTGLIDRPDLPSPHAYLARLFLGRLHEQSGDATRAAALYREAAARVPRGQAARVALGQLLYAAGDWRAAADAINPALISGQGADGIDPWVDYLLGTGSGPALREELRAEVRQ